ncbi:MAG: HAD-IA family hydrolase [Deltaproteobacteria bacterium]|nr:HAD-IA family hydrolase [Deltaproteobacteria bacterium]
MKRLLAVSFDLDGTLYDLERTRLRLLLATFPRWRTLRVGRRVREELRGQTFADGAALLDEEARIVAERLERDVTSTKAMLRDLFEVRLVRVLARVGARPGTRALLQKLVDDGLQIAVISDRGSVIEKLTALGLADLKWSTLVSADDEGLLKPAAALFERCAFRLGVDVKQMLHVGDRDDADGAGARAAGAPFAILGSQALPTLDGVPRVAAELMTLERAT